MRPAPEAPIRYRNSKGEDLLLHGTLLLEADVHPGRRQTLVLAEVLNGPRRFRITLTPEGRVTADVRDAHQKLQLELSADLVEDDTTFRLSFSWDAGDGVGLLSVEDLTRSRLRQCEVESCPPILTSDMAALIDAGRPPASRDLSIGFYAVADTVEPVGLVPAFARDTPVDTPGGQRMVQHLRHGDLVLTTDNGPQPVRWVGRREVPALGELMPVRLRAPYFGLLRDITVSADHRVLITGTEVEYLFGEEAVLVEARYLVNGISASRSNREPVVELYHVLLDNHEILSVSGSRGESLYVGRLGTTRDILETTMLSGIGMTEMPRHAGLAYPALKPFEASTLVAQLG